MHDEFMDEFEKLIWLIAEEFVIAFEVFETMLFAEFDEEPRPLAMYARA